MNNQVLKRLFIPIFLAALSLLGQTGCGLARRHKVNANLPGPVAAGDQPDKILYLRAVNEIQHGRYDVGRLTLQTLLNTYPDSEFLAKSKLAIADSYYSEGGIAGLTQSEAEYKDFITFFPTSPEAPEAQFRVGMAHYRLMGKPDRDRTEARLAEMEFKEFLLKYPDSRFRPRAKGRLREVQEVLGESDYRIAEFYYLKQANRAARSRFQEIADNYPNYSKADSALWYLGQTLERLRDTKDASTYYAELLTDHPLSPLAGDAKGRLTALHQPIPHATRAMMARARADQTHRTNPGLLSRIPGVFGSTPDVSQTRHGPVKLGEKPPGTVLANTPGPGTTGNSVSVEPVSDSALNSGKSTDAKPESGTPTVKTGTSTTDPVKGASDPPGKDKPQAEGTTTKSESDNKTDVPLPKKKSKFHFLKKVIP